MNRLMEYMAKGKIEGEEHDLSSVAADFVYVRIKKYRGRLVEEFTEEEAGFVSMLLKENLPGYSAYSNFYDGCAEVWYSLNKCIIYKDNEEKEALIKQTKEHIESILPVEVEIDPIIDEIIPDRDDS